MPSGLPVSRYTFIQLFMAFVCRCHFIFPWLQRGFRRSFTDKCPRRASYISWNPLQPLPFPRALATSAPGRFAGLSWDGAVRKAHTAKGDTTIYLIKAFFFRVRAERGSVFVRPTRARTALLNETLYERGQKEAAVV